VSEQYFSDECRQTAAVLGQGCSDICSQKAAVLEQGRSDQCHQTAGVLQIKLMTSWAVVCDVYFLEPQTKGPDETSQHFAERVQKLIAQRAKLHVAPWDGYLKYYNLGDKVSRQPSQTRKVHCMQALNASIVQFQPAACNMLWLDRACPMWTSIMIKGLETCMCKHAA